MRRDGPATSRGRRRARPGPRHPFCLPRLYLGCCGVYPYNIFSAGFPSRDLPYDPRPNCLTIAFTAVVFLSVSRRLVLFVFHIPPVVSFWIFSKHRTALVQLSRVRHTRRAIFHRRSSPVLCTWLRTIFVQQTWVLKTYLDIAPRGRCFCRRYTGYMPSPIRPRVRVFVSPKFRSRSSGVPRFVQVRRVSGTFADFKRHRAFRLQSDIPSLTRNLLFTSEFG